MAQQHGADGASAGGQPPVDPITGFWRDVMARSAAAAGGAAAAAPGAGFGMPGFGPGFNPAAGFAAPGAGMPYGAGAAAFTPDALRRMQGAFFDAMAQYAEQYMRTPQFLEAMKRSMDQSLQFRRQMDDFLKTNMASAFESASGGATSEILGAIRQSTSQLQAHIDERLAAMEARIGRLERGTPARESAARETPAKGAAKRR